MSAGRVLIAEDDVLISELLKEILLNLNYEVVGIASSYNRTKELLDSGAKPELALLDIRMHNEDQGVEIAKLMNSHNIPFIFITSFSDKETLQSAVAQQPLGYILKPFKPDEIQDAVEKAFQQMEPRFLVIRDRSTVNHVNVDDIQYLESENVYVTIHTTSGKIVHRTKLADLLESLPSSFIRIHQSFAVNKSYIQKIESNNVIVGEQELPISRSYKAVLLDGM